MLENHFRESYKSSTCRYIIEAKHLHPQRCFTEGASKDETLYKAGFLLWAAESDRSTVKADYAIDTTGECSNSIDLFDEEYKDHAHWNQHTPLKKWCEDVRSHRKGCDFKLVALVKYLFIERQDLHLTQVLVMNLLNSFSFWPGTTESHIKSGQFWSENHILLFLSSAYLFKLKYEESCFTNPCTVSDREVSLLKVYLRSHCQSQFAGMYEVNSPVYLPWSMCALLILYDHAYDVEIKLCAQFLLGKIARQCVLAADRCGVCSLTATCRMPDASLRLQPWSPRLNQFMHFIFGQFDPISGLPVDSVVDLSEGPSIFGDLLALSTWIPPVGDEDPALPSHLLVSNYCTWSGFLHAERMNHKVDFTKSLYLLELNFEGLPESEAAPFYW